MINISVTVLTKNCAVTLRDTLESLRSFAEVVIFDTGSSDTTLDIAREFPNVVIHQGIFQGFGVTHNSATALAKYDWILSIDSDEVLSAELVDEIRQLHLDSPRTLYAIARDNYYRGKQIKGCSGWYPDFCHRLYHRGATQFTEDAVHEKVRTEGLQVVQLRHRLLHTPYRAIADFLTKMQSYTTLFAEQNRGKKRSSLWRAITHSWATFIKSYILKKGFLQGREGFIISSYNAHTAFYKYLKLWEIGPF